MPGRLRIAILAALVFGFFAVLVGLASATARVARPPLALRFSSPFQSPLSCSPGNLDAIMVAIPVQAPSRYGPRESSTSPLPSISSACDEGLSRPFGPSSRAVPFSDSLSPSAASNPMAIRGAEQNDVPPPLPPPRIVPINGPVDPNLQFKESLRREEHGSPDRDSFGLSFRRHDFPLNWKTDFSDDGYHSFDSMRLVPAPELWFGVVADCWS